jgi:hypothetical protein
MRVAAAAEFAAVVAEDGVDRGAVGRNKGTHYVIAPGKRCQEKGVRVSGTFSRRVNRAMVAPMGRPLRVDVGG